MEKSKTKSGRAKSAPSRTIRDKGAFFFLPLLGVIVPFLITGCSRAPYLPETPTPAPVAQTYQAAAKATLKAERNAEPPKIRSAAEERAEQPGNQEGVAAELEIPNAEALGIREAEGIEEPEAETPDMPEAGALWLISNGISRQADRHSRQAVEGEDELDQTEGRERFRALLNLGQAGKAEECARAGLPEKPLAKGEDYAYSVELSIYRCLDLDWQKRKAIGIWNEMPSREQQEAWKWLTTHEESAWGAEGTEELARWAGIEVGEELKAQSMERERCEGRDWPIDGRITKEPEAGWIEVREEISSCYQRERQ